MNAAATIARHAYMARAHRDWTPDMREDATHADAALRTLILAAEIGAAELAIAGRTETARTMLDAIHPFKEAQACTAGVLKGNADLVPAQHTYFTPGDRL